MSEHKIEVVVNDQTYIRTVEARTTLGDFLRSEGYTGVHLACEHGVCGACTIMLDGKAVRSCLTLAVQADGMRVTTVEGLADPEGEMHVVQQALRDEHALQCGFCTPGIVMTLASLTAGNERPSQDVLLNSLSGHICRCTGYQGLKRACRRLGREAQDAAAQAMTGETA